MAAPMTSGAAALVREAHPGWSPLKVKAALANTADASSAKIAGYDPLRAGSGVIQVDRAVATLALATTSDRTASLSFGYEQIDGSYSETKTITITNTGSRDVWYTLAASSPLVSHLARPGQGPGARLGSGPRPRLPVRAPQVAALPSADQFITGNFGGLDIALRRRHRHPDRRTRAGYFALRVPYLLVPRGVSDDRRHA